MNFTQIYISDDELIPEYFQYSMNLLKIYTQTVLTHFKIIKLAEISLLKIFK